jgi:hypothetical protein
MAATGLVWDVPPDHLAAAVGSYGERLYRAVVALAEFFAAKIEAHAKQHARWTDRTGHARQGLVARVVPTAAVVVIFLASLADYGIFLELAHQGRWGIVLPTLRAHEGEIAAAVQRLVR